VDEKLKQRLVGAAVVVSLGIIFLPMILDGGRHTDFEKIRIEIPSPPDRGFSSTIEPITPVVSKPAPVVPKTVSPSSVDIDKQGKAPVVDEEISKIIAPIEPATRIVNRPAEPAKTVTKKPEAKKPIPAEKIQLAKPVGKEKTPVLVKSASPVSAWVVQVGSFDSRDNAIVLRDSLRKRGFISFVESFEKDGRPSHRVRIGPEVEREKAEKILVNLQKKMSLSGIIVSYP